MLNSETSRLHFIKFKIIFICPSFYYRDEKSFSTSLKNYVYNIFYLIIAFVLSIFFRFFYWRIIFWVIVLLFAIRLCNFFYYYFVEVLRIKEYFSFEEQRAIVVRADIGYFIPKRRIFKLKKMRDKVSVNKIK